MTKSLNFFQCPVCGADVPPSARACPECGADDTTGWNDERAVYDGLDLPDGEFDYDAYVQKEFGKTGNPGKKHRAWLYAIGLILLLIAIVLVSL